MARIFTCGYEENNLTATMWDSVVGSPTIVTTSPHSGTYVLEGVSSSASFLRRLLSDFTSGTLFGRVYFYHVSGAVDSFGIIAEFVNNSSVTGLAVQYNSNSRVLKLLNSITSTSTTGSFVLSTGTWYRLEFRHLISDTIGEMELRIYTGDSTTAEETLSITGEDTLPTEVNRFLVGNVNGIAGLFRFDDIGLNDDSGSAPLNTWVDPGKIFLVKPSGDSSVTWTKAGSTPAATNFEGIDELPGAPNDGVDYNESTGTTNVDKLDMTDLGAEVPSDADIILLDVYGRVGGDGAIARTLVFRLWDEGDTSADGPAVSCNINGWRIITINEHQVFDAGARTKADINSFRTGYKANTGSTRVKRITAQWMNVEWIESAGVDLVALERHYPRGVGRGVLRGVA